MSTTTTTAPCTTMPPTRQDRSEGALLVELAIAVALLVVGAMGFMFTFYASSRAVASVEDIDRVSLALNNVTELLRGADFDTTYATYHGASIVAQGVVDERGVPARIEITCHVDETNLPEEFGSELTDIDGNDGNADSDCSGSYEILPVQLSVTFASTEGLTTRELFILLSPDLRSEP